jgi:hypothetical protein
VENNRNFLDEIRKYKIMIVNIVFVLIGNSKRAYRFRKEEYKEGDVIHIELAQEVSFLNKSAIKSTLNQIPG